MTQKRLHFLSAHSGRIALRTLACILLASRPYCLREPRRGRKKNPESGKADGTHSQRRLFLFIYLFFFFYFPFAFFNSMSGSPLDSKLFGFVFHFLLVIITRHRSLTRTFFFGTRTLQAKCQCCVCVRYTHRGFIDRSDLEESTHF